MSFAEFKIKTRADVVKMQSSLLKQESADKRFIALELADNMVDAGETGEILINDIQIINRIDSKTKIDEIREVVGKAAFFKKNGITDRVNGSTDNKTDLGGKGLLSILHCGWDLDVQELSAGVCITATRCSS